MLNQRFSRGVTALEVEYKFDPVTRLMWMEQHDGYGSAVGDFTYRADSSPFGIPARHHGDGGNVITLDLSVKYVKFPHKIWYTLPFNSDITKLWSTYPEFGTGYTPASWPNEPELLY
jgi:hypothetical protein